MHVVDLLKSESEAGQRLAYSAVWKTQAVTRTLPILTRRGGGNRRSVVKSR